MPAENAMYHRCTIERDTNAQVGDAADEWGNQLAAVFVGNPVATNIPCRFWYNLSDTIMDSEKRVVSTEMFLHLPYGTDVLPNDRIGDITDRRGSVLAEGPMRIDELGPHEYDHLVAKLIRIT